MPIAALPAVADVVSRVRGRIDRGRMLSRRTLSEGRATQFDATHKVRGRWTYPRPGVPRAPVPDPLGTGKGLTPAGRCAVRENFAKTSVESKGQRPPAKGLAGAGDSACGAFFSRGQVSPDVTGAQLADSAERI